MCPGVGLRDKPKNYSGYEPVFLVGPAASQLPGSVNLNNYSGYDQVSGSSFGVSGFGFGFYIRSNASGQVPSIY